MLAVHTDKKIVVYSLGKTGTTSFINSLSDDWHSTGEISADFMKKLYPDSFEGHVDQYKALQFLYERNFKLYIIMRNPWKRYVSGIKEVMQDNLNIIYKDPINEVYNGLSDDQLTKSIDRLFYLSEFKRENDFPFDKKFPYPSDFAIHHNYHTKNWLYSVKDLNATFIDSSELDNFIKELNLSPATHTNVSDPVFLKRLEECIKNTDIFFYIQKYLESELESYQKLL
tara:strand:- start:527 stop:1207 length:681 start_codon:yes stop_codon:yes gene_type:complete